MFLRRYQPRQRPAGSIVGIFFEHKNKFMRQDARIDAVVSTDEKFTLGVTTTGEAVSAEGRACYRATTVTDNIRATINGKDVCQVLDVSATGCSVRSNKSYTISDTVDVAIEHLGKRYRGKVTVQGVKTLGKNDYRYGLCCVESAPSATSLHNGLQAIFAAVQRTQLKRLAGAA